MLLAALILAAAAPAPKATATPNPVIEIPLKRVVVAFPTPDEAVVTLHGEGRELAAPELVSQRLKLGDVEVPDAPIAVDITASVAWGESLPTAAGAVNRPRMKISSLRVPHSTASAPANGRFRTAVRPSSPRFGFQSCGKP